MKGEGGEEEADMITDFPFKARCKGILIRTTFCFSLISNPHNRIRN